MTKSDTVTTKLIDSSFAAKVIEPCDWTKQLNIPFSFRIFKFFHCVHVHLKMRLVQNSFASIRREFPSKNRKKSANPWTCTWSHPSPVVRSHTFVHAFVFFCEREEIKITHLTALTKSILLTRRGGPSFATGSKCPCWRHRSMKFSKTSLATYF